MDAATGTTSRFRIRNLESLGEREVRELSRVLVDCVEGGASVSFMSPMSAGKAAEFWRGVGDSVARAERFLLVAEDQAGAILGTVQVILRQPENQPHRGDLAKMLVHPGARRRGVGEALLLEAEKRARAAGKTLLVLDTASDSAERLYERGGWKRVGVIPGYALSPDGMPLPTTYYYKVLAGAP